MASRGFGRIYALLVVFVLVGIAVWSIDREDALMSERENRYLALAPVADWASVWDGTYFSTLENYVTDQFPIRDDLIYAYAKGLSMAGAEKIHDVVIGKNNNLLPYYPYSFSSGSGSGSGSGEGGNSLFLGEVARWGAINQTVASYGGHMLSVMIPAKQVVMYEDYPAGYMDMSARLFDNLAFQQQAMQEAGVETLSMLAPFIEENKTQSVYFQTDHHINHIGAQMVYERLMDRLSALDGRVSKSTFEWKAIDAPFIGSYNRQIAGAVANSDVLYLPEPKGGFPAYVRTEGQSVIEGLYTIPRVLEAGVSYSVYMGGDKAETIISTNRPELAKALIIGNSHTNIVEPLLVDAFDELRCLDLRYFDQQTQSLEAYIADYEPDVVILMYAVPLATFSLS